MPPVFTSGEIQRIVGVSQRQLTYWDRSGLVQPQGRPALGRGSRRLYTVLDIVQLKVIRQLLDSGISLQKVRDGLRVLTALMDEPAPLAELEILTDGHRMLVRRSNEQVVDPLTRQFVLRLPLSDLLAEMHIDAASITNTPPALADLSGAIGVPVR